MKNLLLTLLFAASFLSIPSQNRVTRTASSKNPENYGTDSARRGHEIYEGGKERKSKSNGDTVKGYKKGPAKQNGSIKKSASGKSRPTQNGLKSHKKITLVMNDFKV
ncbi:MAG: hypothetical protein V4635_07755 [Bacteroidota bacterium]